MPALIVNGDFLFYVILAGLKIVVGLSRGNLKERLQDIRCNIEAGGCQASTRR